MIITQHNFDHRTAHKHAKGFHVVFTKWLVLDKLVQITIAQLHCKHYFMFGVLNVAIFGKPYVLLISCIYRNLFYF